MGFPADAPNPRLCHIIRWQDFDGYGFNLHADKSRPGQYIGKIDEGSPAEVAGLKEGDRIIEVNGINIINETHKQVVQRIKAVAEETRLLVVDSEADKWFKDNNIVIRGDQDNIIYGTSKRESSEPPSPASSQGKDKLSDVIGETDNHSLASSHSSASVPSRNDANLEESKKRSAPEPPVRISSIKDEELKQDEESDVPKSDINGTDPKVESEEDHVVLEYDNVRFEAEQEALKEETRGDEDTQGEKTLKEENGLNSVSTETESLELKDPESCSDNMNNVSDSKLDENVIEYNVGVSKVVLNQESDEVSSKLNKDNESDHSDVESHKSDKDDLENAKPMDKIDTNSIKSDKDDTGSIKDDTIATKYDKDDTNSIKSNKDDTKSNKDDTNSIKSNKDDTNSIKSNKDDTNSIKSNKDDTNSIKSNKDDTNSIKSQSDSGKSDSGHKDSVEDNKLEKQESISPSPTEIQPPKTVTDSNGSPATNGRPASVASSNGGLNFNMSAAEMRAQLALKKKFDPRKDTIDLKKKYQIVQNM